MDNNNIKKAFLMKGLIHVRVLYLRNKGQTDRHTDRQTDTQTHRQTGTETDRYRYVFQLSPEIFAVAKERKFKNISWC